MPFIRLSVDEVARKDRRVFDNGPFCRHFRADSIHYFIKSSREFLALYFDYPLRSFIILMYSFDNDIEHDMPSEAKVVGIIAIILAQLRRGAMTWVV